MSFMFAVRLYVCMSVCMYVCLYDVCMFLYVGGVGVCCNQTKREKHSRIRVYFSRFTGVTQKSRPTKHKQAVAQVQMHPEVPKPVDRSNGLAVSNTWKSATEETRRNGVADGNQI